MEWSSKFLTIFLGVFFSANSMNMDLGGALSQINADADSSDSEKIASLQQSVSQLTQQVSSLKGENARLSQENQSISSSNNQLTIRNKSLSQKYKELQDQQSGSQSQLTSLNKDLAAAKASLKTAQQNAESSIKALEQQNAELKNKNKALQDDNGELLTELNQADKDLERKDTIIKNTQTQLASAQTQLTTAQASLQAANKKIEELQSSGGTGTGSSGGRLSGGQSSSGSTTVGSGGTTSGTGSETGGSKESGTSSGTGGSKESGTTGTTTGGTTGTDTSSATDNFNLSDLNQSIANLNNEWQQAISQGATEGGDCPVANDFNMTIDMAQEFAKLIEHNKQILLEERNLRACLERNNNDEAKCPITLKSIDYANLIASDQQDIMTKLNTILTNLTGQSSIPLPIVENIDVETLKNIGGNIIDANINFVENWSRDKIKDGLMFAKNSLSNAIKKNCKKIPKIIVDHIDDVLDKIMPWIDAATFAALGAIYTYVKIKSKIPGSSKLFDEIDLGDGLEFKKIISKFGGKERISYKINITIEDVDAAYTAEKTRLTVQENQLKADIEAIDKEIKAGVNLKTELKEAKAKLKAVTSKLTDINTRYGRFSKRSVKRRNIYIEKRVAKLEQVRDFLQQIEDGLSGEDLTNAFKDAVNERIDALKADLKATKLTNIKEIIDLKKQISSLQNLRDKGFESMGEGMQKALYEASRPNSNGKITVDYPSTEPTVEPVEPVVQPTQPLTRAQEITDAFNASMKNMENSLAEGKNMPDSITKSGKGYIEFTDVYDKKIKQVFEVEKVDGSWQVKAIDGVPEGYNLVKRTIIPKSTVSSSDGGFGTIDGEGDQGFGDLLTNINSLKEQLKSAISNSASLDALKIQIDPLMDSLNTDQRNLYGEDSVPDYTEIISGENTYYRDNSTGELFNEMQEDWDLGEDGENMNTLNLDTMDTTF